MLRREIKQEREMGCICMCECKKIWGGGSAGEVTFEGRHEEGEGGSQVGIWGTGSRQRGQ